MQDADVDTIHTWQRWLSGESEAEACSSPPCVLLSFPTPAVSGCYFRGDAHGACGGDIQKDGPEAGPGHKERVRNAAVILAHSTLEDRAPCSASISVVSSRFWKVGLMCNKSGSEIRDSSPTTKSIFLM